MGEHERPITPSGIEAALGRGERVPADAIRRLPPGAWLRLCRAVAAKGWQMRYDGASDEWWAEWE